MLRVLIWQVSDDMTSKDFALKVLEYQHDGLEIVGEAVNDDIAKVDRGGDYEILVVGAKKIGMSTVTQNARRLNLPEEKLLGDWIVTIPGFTLEKYRHLQRSQLSIFSSDCFGGLISHLLALPFRSPFVNLYMTKEDYLKFLIQPNLYIVKEPHFEKLVSRSLEAPNGFPLLSLGDILLYMMHYKEPNDAIEKWNERKCKINWYNLLVIMATHKKELLEQFDALPYGKKVCFVPFKSDLDSAWYINPEIDKEAKNFGDVMLRFMFGESIIYYDLFDMFLYGKKTPLIEM